MVPFQLLNVYESKLLRPLFTLTGREDNRIRLEIHFDYEYKQVSSQLKARRITIFSDADLERKGFSKSGSARLHGL